MPSVQFMSEWTFGYCTNFSFNFELTVIIKYGTVFMVHITFVYVESSLITGTGSDQTTGSISGTIW